MSQRIPIITPGNKGRCVPSVFRRFVANTRGATTIEYTIYAGVLVISIVAVAGAFREELDSGNVGLLSISEVISGESGTTETPSKITPPIKHNALSAARVGNSSKSEKKDFETFELRLTE